MVSGQWTLKIFYHKIEIYDKQKQIIFFSPADSNSILHKLKI